MNDSRRAQAGSKRTALRECRTCGVEKPLTEEHFYKHSKTQNTYRGDCRECWKDIVRFRKMGISREVYEAMFREQKFRCAICNCKLSSSRYTKLCIDHCHRSGKIRGLLCLGCNTGIGNLKENRIVFEAAIKYIENGGFKYTQRVEDMVRAPE